jgi:hypothetical protein
MAHYLLSTSLASSIPHLHLSYDASRVVHKEVFQVLAVADETLVALPLQIVSDLTLAKAAPADMAQELAKLAPQDVGKFILSKKKSKVVRPSFAPGKAGAATEKLYKALSNTLEGTFGFTFGLAMKGNPLRAVTRREQRNVDAEGHHYLIDTSSGPPHAVSTCCFCCVKIRS